MLSEEQLDVLSGALVPLYQHLEAWVIADVARRIRNTMMYTRTAELEVQALQKLGYSPARIRAEVMRILRADKAFQKQVEENTLHFKREVAAKLAEITAAAQKAGAEVVSSAGEMSWKDDISLWDSAGADLKEDGTLKQIVEAMQKQTRGELKNLTRTTGFRTASGMEPVKEVYQKELDKALVKVSSGAVTKEQCVREVVQDLARSGLRTIDYDSGRSYQLDTASRMCVNTAAGQLAAQVCNSNIQKTEVTLVQVSAHWGARDKGEGVKNHKEWQGKVYSIDGQLHPEEEKRIGMEIRDLAECTGYSVQEGIGDIEGLHGVNCRHNHHPFFEGISTPVKYDPEPEAKEINGRMYSYYDMTQGMRRREREIRALKREKEALDTLGEDAAEVRAKIRQKTKEYNSFCDECGLRRKPKRLRVESGASDLMKTEAWKEYEKEKQTKANTVDTSGKSDTIEKDIEESTDDKVIEVHTVGRIDRGIYKCITDDIMTDEVVITDERIQHIKDRHPEDYERFRSYMPEIIAKPDYIIEANKPNTAVILKEIIENGEKFQLVLRIKTATDRADFKNSVITFLNINERTWNKYLRNKHILYKGE